VALNPDSSWLAACDVKNQCVWKLDLTTLTLTRWIEQAGGTPIAIPNHGAFDFEGNYYLSDSGDAFQATGRIIKADRNGHAHVWHKGPIAFANGVALGPQKNSLFVVSSFLPGVERIAIQPDGTAGERMVHTTLPSHCIPDGLAFAKDGSLFVSCYEPSVIYRVDQKGAATPFLSDPQAHGLCHSTNIAFAGTDFSDLLVANLGRWHISRIPAGQPGLLLPSQQ
jgi:sugar lactone lactonase YvrE